jgi:hypothetical protein
LTRLCLYAYIVRNFTGSICQKIATFREVRKKQLEKE